MPGSTWGSVRRAVCTGTFAQHTLPGFNRDKSLEQMLLLAGVGGTGRVQLPTPVPAAAKLGPSPMVEARPR